MKKYCNYFPRTAEKLNPFYKLLKVETPIHFTARRKETFVSANKALSDACEQSLKKVPLGNELVLMTDANVRGTGYPHMIQDNPDQKSQSKRKTYASPLFGSKVFYPAPLKVSVYSKTPAIYMAILKFAKFFWETTKPLIILTDFKSVTHFFQMRAIPPALWNACGFLLQINFKLAHIAD